MCAEYYFWLYDGLFSFETPLLDIKRTVRHISCNLTKIGILRFIVYCVLCFGLVIRGVHYFENCCFGCRLWLLFQFQRLVCEFVLKGLVPSHSAKSIDFSRWGIINIWINFDWHHKGLWTWTSSSNQHFRSK